MNPAWKSYIKKRLEQVSGHTITEYRYTCPQNAPISHSEPFPSAADGKGKIETYELYPGITLSIIDVMAEQAVFPHTACFHAAGSHTAGSHTVQNSVRDSVIVADYCRYGRIGWETEQKSPLYLGPGDLSVYLMSRYAHSAVTLPLGYYEGITIFIDLQKLSAEPPELLRQTKITGKLQRQTGAADELLQQTGAAIELLRQTDTADKLLQQTGTAIKLLPEIFCDGKASPVLPGNERIWSIFYPLFDLPENLRFPYFRLKAQELLLYLCQLSQLPADAEFPADTKKTLTGYQTDQIHTIRQIHEQLMQNLDQRITIEALSRQYLMNPTTLKEVFKTVYGTSIAAHMKEHRMEEAARLLRDTNESVAQIANAVGYESQSKFTAAFKDAFGVMPTLYRKTYDSSGNRQIHETCDGSC